MSTAREQLELIEKNGPQAILTNGKLPELDNLYKLYVYAKNTKWANAHCVSDEEVTLHQFAEEVFFNQIEKDCLRAAKLTSLQELEEIRKKYNYMRDPRVKPAVEFLDKRIKHVAAEEIIERYTDLLEHGFVGIAQRLLGLTIFKSENVLELTPKHGRSIGNDIYDLRAVDTKLISQKALDAKAGGKDPCKEHFCSRKLHGERITKWLVAYKDNCSAVFDPVNLQVFLSWLARELCRLNHVHSVTSAENNELGKVQKRFPELAWQEHYMMVGINLLNEDRNEVDLSILKNADVYRTDSVWERLIERIENGQLDRWFA